MPPVLICIVVTLTAQGAPADATAAELHAASQGFDFVMALCATSLVVSTSIYMVADPQPWRPWRVKAIPMLRKANVQQ